MNNKKIKVGDRVKYISQYYRTLPIGTEGTVIEACGITTIKIKWKNWRFPSGRDYNTCFRESVKLMEVPINVQLEFEFMNEI